MILTVPVPEDNCWESARRTRQKHRKHPAQPDGVDFVFTAEDCCC